MPVEAGHEVPQPGTGLREGPPEQLRPGGVQGVQEPVSGRGLVAVQQGAVGAEQGEPHPVRERGLRRALGPGRQPQRLRGLSGGQVRLREEHRTRGQCLGDGPQRGERRVPVAVGQGGARVGEGEPGGRSRRAGRPRGVQHGQGRVPAAAGDLQLGPQGGVLRRQDRVVPGVGVGGGAVQVGGGRPQVAPLDRHGGQRQPGGPGAVLLRYAAPVGSVQGGRAVLLPGRQGALRGVGEGEPAQAAGQQGRRPVGARPYRLGEALPRRPDPAVAQQGAGPPVLAQRLDLRVACPLLVRQQRHELRDAPRGPVGRAGVGGGTAAAAAPG
ncbi:hypothetical protein [Streptomyces sp. CS62]|uniref:hypothetical protein n=1 Tax=Streptomyces sp. CS62 TaxID=3119268 RepID=UPI003FA73C6C